MRYIVLFICFALLLFPACEKEEIISLKEVLIGEWNWELSSGGFGGIKLTPQSENENRKIIFRQNDFKTVVNDSLIGTFKYKIEFIEEEKYILARNDYFINQEIHIENNKLTLIDKCDDCMIHIYKRTP